MSNVVRVVEVGTRYGVAALRREWAVVALAGFVALSALGVTEPLWLVGAVPIWGYCSWLLFRTLDENRVREGSALFSSLGWPTLVTLARGWLVAVVGGFLFLPEGSGAAAWLPALAYTIAVTLDYVDGRLARRLGRETRLGSKLDMELDASGILIASLLGILYGKLPLWYLAVGLARYAFVLGGRWRRHHGKAVRELPPSSLRRWLAGAQMGFLAGALYPAVPSPLSQLLAVGFGGATLAVFVRDWLIVSRGLRETSESFR